MNSQNESTLLYIKGGRQSGKTTRMLDMVSKRTIWIAPNMAMQRAMRPAVEARGGRVVVGTDFLIGADLRGVQIFIENLDMLPANPITFLKYGVSVVVSATPTAFDRQNPPWYYEMWCTANHKINLKQNKTMAEKLMTYPQPWPDHLIAQLLGVWVCK